MYQRKVDVDMLNVVKSMLADVSSVSPSSEQTYSLRRSAYPHQPRVDSLYILAGTGFGSGVWSGRWDGAEVQLPHLEVTAAI